MTGAPNRTVKFLMLMPWGRVGSNLIFDSIWQRAHRAYAEHEFHLENESLNARPDAQQQLSWARNFFSRSDLRLIGAKQNVRALCDPRSFLDKIGERDVRYICVRRRDLMKAAVSQIRAQLFADRTRQLEGRARWALRTEDTPLGPVRIDPDLYSKTLEQLQEADNLLIETMRGTVHLEIAYEDLLKDPEAAIESVCEILGLGGYPSKLRFKKSTPDDLSCAVTNLDQLVALTPSRYVDTATA